MRTAITLLLLLALAGCQSTELTSMKVHYQSGRYDLAVESGLRALVSEPDNADVHFYLALAYRELDQPALTFKHFSASKAIDPERADMVDRNIASVFAAYYNEGLRLIQTGDVVRAAKRFELAAEANPADGRAPYQRGRICFDDGEFDCALSFFALAMSRLGTATTEHNSALSLSARAHAAQGNRAAMLGDLRWLLKKAPERYADAEVIAFEAVADEDWPLAAYVLVLAADARFRVEAEDYHIYYNLGVAYYQTGEASAAQAVAAFERALALRPDDLHTRLVLAKACLLAKDWRAAAQHGELYAKALPDDRVVWQLLARAYGALGERDKARSCSIRYEALANE